MVESKALTTPLDRDLKLQVESGTTTHDSTHYRQGIRSLIYFILSQPSDSYTFGFNDCIMFDAVDVTIHLQGCIWIADVAGNSGDQHLHQASIILGQYHLLEQQLVDYCGTGQHRGKI